MIKIIKTTDIPPAQTLKGKPSKVPELLKTIPKGQTGTIDDTDKDHKIATIRSYIEKQHKKGHLTQYTLQQRTNKDKHKTLYITHESKTT